MSRDHSTHGWHQTAKRVDSRQEFGQ